MQLNLLDAFELECDGAPVDLPMSARRVVAFVAIQDRPVRRAYVAGSLWLDSSEEHAHANLRSALWRLHRSGVGVVEPRGQLLALGSDVVVDLREAERLARLALAGDLAGVELAPSALAGDLLPDWYDDWIVFERERFRQVRLAALDALCERLTRAGRLRDALDVGLAAVAGEPLRESAHRAVIRVHLAEGNLAEAIRQYRLCRSLLADQLGIEPSQRMHELMRGLDGSETVR
jgi:DNA-binding SARP family transcriptional activator